MIAGTEKVLAGSGWTRVNAGGQCLKSAHGWKGGRPRVHSAVDGLSRDPEDLKRQKLRESHETIQQFTSHLQQMQEQMNSMNDSGDFQDAESNYSGRLSHFSSQLVRIQSSRSLLSRDKRLPLDTWNQPEIQENVFANQFSTFDSPRDLPERMKLFLEIQK